MTTVYYKVFFPHEKFERMCSLCCDDSEDPNTHIEKEVEKTLRLTAMHEIEKEEIIRLKKSAQYMSMVDARVSELKLKTATQLDLVLTNVRVRHDRRP